jgi:hypothetical protein
MHPSPNPSSQEFIVFKIHSLPRLGVAGAVALSLAAALAGVAEPVQARDRSATVSGSNGHGATRNVQRAGGDVSSSTTGNRGRTASRQVDRSAESTQATATGPNGNTRTRESVRDGEGNGSTTVTRANGSTATRDVTRQP